MPQRFDFKKKLIYAIMLYPNRSSDVRRGSEMQMK